MYLTLLVGITMYTDVTEQKRSAVTMTSPFGKREHERLRWWVDRGEKEIHPHLVFTSQYVCAWAKASATRCFPMAT